MPTVRKGDRIIAQWFAEAKPVALSGANMKVQMTEFAVVGVVRHVRGDDPIAPKTIRFYVDPDGDCESPKVRPPGCACPTAHVEVDPKHVMWTNGT